MIVLCVLEGYSRSISPVDVSDMVEAELCGADYTPLIAKSWFGRHQVRRFVKFARQYEHPNNVLFLVGKSLGGRNIVRVFNRLIPHRYKGIVIFTIDINYPTFRDWTPNLNQTAVCLWHEPRRAINVYSLEPNKRRQAGAYLSHDYLPFRDSGFDIANCGVEGYNHQTIVGSPAVKRKLKQTVSFVRWLSRKDRA